MARLPLGLVCRHGQQPGFLVIALNTVHVDQLANVVNRPAAKFVRFPGPRLAETPGSEVHGQAHQRHREASVTAAGAISHHAVLKYHHAQGRVLALQVVGAGDAAKTATHHRDVYALVSIQWRTLSVGPGRRQPERLLLVVPGHVNVPSSSLPSYRP